MSFVIETIFPAVEASLPYDNDSPQCSINTITIIVSFDSLNNSWEQFIQEQLNNSNLNGYQMDELDEVD